MRPLLAALLARWREPRTRWALLAVGAFQAFVLLAIDDPREVRRATATWTLPLAILAALATAVGDEWQRQRSGWRDLEFLHAHALWARVTIDWCGRCGVAAALVALPLAPFALPFLGARLDAPTHHGRRPFATVGTLDLWTPGDGFRLPPADLAGCDRLRVPYAARPLDPDRPGNDRLRIDLGFERDGELRPRTLELDLRDTLEVRDLAGETGRLVVRHAGPEPGLVRFEFDRLHLLGDRVSPFAAWFLLATRLVVFLAWALLLFAAAHAVLDLPVAALWTAFALLPTWIELPDGLRLALGRDGLEIYRNIVPDWNAGLALVPWADGVLAPLGDLPWTACIASAMLLFAVRVAGTRRHARRLEPREDVDA